MDLWMKLLFGNPIGLMSIIVVAIAVAIIVFFATFLYRKSHEKN